MKFRVGQQVRICRSRVPGYGRIGIVKEAIQLTWMQLLKVRMEDDDPPFWYSYSSRYFELYTVTMQANEILKRGE